MGAEFRYLRTIAIVTVAIVAWVVAMAVAAANHVPPWASLTVGFAVLVAGGAFALVRWLRGVQKRMHEFPDPRFANRAPQRATIMPPVVSAALIALQCVLLALYVPVVRSGQATKDQWQMIALLLASLAIALWTRVRRQSPPDEAATARFARRLRAYGDARALPPGPARDRARAAVRRDVAYKLGIIVAALALWIALGPHLGWVVAILASFGPLTALAYFAERRLSM